MPYRNFQKAYFNKCKGMIYGLCNVILRTICKNRNRKLGNRMRGMMEMRDAGIKVGMRIIRM